MAHARFGRRLGHLLDGEKVFGYTLVAPAVLYILLLVGYPFAIALWFTVSDATVSQPIGPFTGLDNLKFVLDDDIFRRALLNTFIFTISSQILQMVLGTVLAFLLLRPFRGKRIIRALVMFPFTIPVAIGAMAWTWMFNPSYSVINHLGADLGAGEARHVAEFGARHGPVVAQPNEHPCLRSVLGAGSDPLHGRAPFALRRDRHGSMASLT